MTRGRLATPLLVAPALAFLAVVLFYPLARTVEQSFTDPTTGLENYRHLFASGVYVRVLLTTLLVSGLVTGICLLLGYPLAYTAATRGGGVRALVLAAVMIPFWTSLLVRTYAWQVILGREGPIASLLDAVGVAAPQLLYNRIGAVVGMVYVMLPFMVLSLYAVMRDVDPSLLRAARSLGAPAGRAFRHVYLPQTLPGVTGGVLLVFVISIGFYVTPALLGGRKEVFIAELIQMNVTETVQWGFASALGVVLLLVTLALLAAYDRLLGAESMFAAGRREGRA
ncbi:MAG: ABC transporter permease [Actinobacteria bacterium]|nr:ABC transporter permease [Actinomycetota bacterium]